MASNNVGGVNAIQLLDEGRLLVSTANSVSGLPAPSGTNVSAESEDLLAFTPTLSGQNTAGIWQLYFDGSDENLSSNELNAGSADAAGNIYLSTQKDFFVTGVAWNDEDVFAFTASSLGSSTAGTFSPNLFFNSNLYGLGNNDLTGIDVPVSAGVVTTSSARIFFAHSD